MKIMLRVVSYSVLLLLLGNLYADAQTGKKLPDYSRGSAAWKALIKEKMKSSGQQKKATKQVTSMGNQPPATLATPACFVPIDGTFTALPRDNDGNSGLITLPFAFDLY